MKRPPYIEHLPSGLLRIRVPDPFRKKDRINVTGHNEASVRARADQIRRTIEDFRLGAIGEAECRKAITRVAFGAPTLRDVWDSYASTLRGEWGKVKVPGIWRSRVEPYFAKAKVYELEPAVMAAWETAELAKGLAPKTIVNAFHCIRAAVRMSLDQVEGLRYPWLNWRPLGNAKDSEASQRESFVSLEEVRMLMHAANRYDTYLEGKGLFADVAIRIFVAALTGARQGELAALGWDHVLLPDELPPDGSRLSAEIRVWKTCRPNWQTEHPNWTRPLDDPKGRRHRQHRLHYEVARALFDRRERLRGRGWYRIDGPVFPTYGGKWRLQPETINGSVFRAIVAQAGFPTERFSPHSLRHTFCTLTAQAAFMLTGDIQAAKILTGHSNVKTLEGYLHRGSRGLPESLIPELGQASLPGLPFGALPAAERDRKTLAVVALETDRQLSGLASAIVVHRAPDPWASPNAMAEIARKHPHGIPDTVANRADGRYRRAYNEAKREGKDKELCAVIGKRARSGFLSSWRKAQKSARASLPARAPEAPRVSTVEVEP